MTFDTKRCLICRRPRPTLYWHRDPDTESIWVWCTGKCQRGYSLRDYVYNAGISLSEFLKGDFDFEDSKPNEVNRLEWPSNYVSMLDSRANDGVEYMRSRGLTMDGDMYYDIEKEAVVFPYYFGSVFVGAQSRLLTPWVGEDGETTKMLTLPGTRLGLVFYNWNQEPFVTDIKAVIVCEGAINTLSLQQSLNTLYGGVLKNPFKVVATSGCGTTNHQMEKLKELKNAGKKIIASFDSDEAGLKGLKKMVDNEVATHYALTNDTEMDWNDVLVNNGNMDTAREFIRSINDIECLPV